MGTQHGMALRALVEELARLRGHGLQPDETAVRAGQRRLEDACVHGWFTVAGRCSGNGCEVVRGPGGLASGTSKIKRCCVRM